MSKSIGDYYLGLDIGTNSIGWAATNENYDLLQIDNKATWGVRLFEEAQTAANRRINRSNRRRIQRTKQRIIWLNELLEEELNRVDPNFLKRLEESKIKEDCKIDKNGKYSSIIFPIKKEEKQFYKKYPTISHLKKDFLENIDNQYTKDIRCLYLILHQYFKARGHFLLTGELMNNDQGISQNYFNDLLLDFLNFISEEFGIYWDDNKVDEFKKILLSQIGVNDKTKQLKNLLFINNSELNHLKQQNAIIKLIAGGTINIDELFDDDNLVESEFKKLCFKGINYEEEVRPNLETILVDKIVLIDKLKQIYDYVILQNILSGERYLSYARIKMYEQHREDLKLLKDVVRQEKYKVKKKLVFDIVDDKINNYAKYTGKRCGVCSQEELCVFLKKELFNNCKNDEGLNKNEKKLYQKISEKKFCSKQRSIDNGVIPNQVHCLELEKILENCFKSFSFLGRIDQIDSTANKLVKIMKFRIPYFVGPLNGNEMTRKKGRFWLEKIIGQENTKITPWNFKQVVDEKACAEKFINNLTNYCTYLKGEKVLPKSSLLYQKYVVLNELNNLKIKNQKPNTDVKQKIFNKLFMNKNKVSRKALVDFYQIEYGEKISKEDISGIDLAFNNSLSTYLALKADFADLLITQDGQELIENVILWSTIFGNEKRMLKEKIEKVYGNKINQQQINKLVSKNFNGWGKLSNKFLTGIYGQAIEGDYCLDKMSIIDALWESNYNLMELLSDNHFSFWNTIEKENQTNTEISNFDKVSYDLVEEMYVSPAVKRAIWQALRIVAEIIKFIGKPPKKIFIESTRDATGQQKGQRTNARRQQIEYFYKNIKEDFDVMNQLKIELNNTSDDQLKSKKFFLYFMQMGKCMYSGKPIRLEELNNQNFYDVDHIYPRSLTKDDSLSNLVLVEAKMNREKTDTYPLDLNIQNERKSFWNYLLKINLLSKEKHGRLLRTTRLTDDELASFINRQLVETSQANKEVKNVLINLYGENTKVVFSKAGLVSDFRHEFNLYKCRAVNNFHHAHDAYLNIVVGNVYNVKFTDNPYNFVKKSAQRSYSLKPEVFWRNFNIEKNGMKIWEKAGRNGLSYDKNKACVVYDESKDEGSIKKVRQVLAKPNILVTRMTRTGKALLSKVTILPVGKGMIRIKKDLPIEKYGGYTNSGTAYFCVIERDEIKNKVIKKVKTIETITVMEKEKYEKGPIAYFQDQGYKNVRLLVPQMKVGSLLKIDNAYVTIAGKTGDRFLLNISSELFANQERIRYFRYLDKFVALRKKIKNVLLSNNTLVTKEKNENLYDFFLSKFEQKIYSDVFSSIWQNYIEQGKQKFLSLALEEQCEVLMQILQFFTCNAVSADLSLINGKANRILISKNITGKKIKLINQSITGLAQNSIIL